jgi:group II intron reverse transcriptase/maturase
VLDADIRKYFDRIDHGQLRKILDRRVRDGVIRRLIDKWLKAGVWEQGKRYVPESGTPQGGVISPLLSNIYLHEVLDDWFMTSVQPRMKGRTRIYRFADDFLLVFASREDAQRVLEVLPKRLGRFGLEMNLEKTRLIHFHKPWQEGPGGGKKVSSEVFQFLGFTHYWGKSRRGRWVVRRRTAGNRLSRSLRGIADWCRRHRHDPVQNQHRKLSQKMVGHYNYYGITGNWDRLSQYLFEVSRIWRKWLNRRTRPGTMPWTRFNQLLEHYPLPAVKIYHSVYAAKPSA